MPKLKRAFVAFRKKVAEKALIFGMTYAPEYFNAKVEQTAKMAATQFAFEYLAKEGILHCEFCAKRFPLRRMKNGALVCETHFQKISEANLKAKNAEAKS